MNGNLAYEQRYERKIQNILNKNTQLYGFYSFMNNKAISTRYNYLNIVYNFLNDIRKSPYKLTLDDFTKFMLKSQKTLNGDNTTSSFRVTIYQALKKYGNYLVANHQLDRNPMDFIDKPKQKDSQKTIIKRENGFLSEDEIEKYIDCVKLGTYTSKNITYYKERDLAIIMIFLNTGIRCSALMKIDINDINFNMKTLTVTDKEDKVNTYDLSDKLIEIINDWLIKRKQMLNGKEEEALFISDRKQRMCPGTIAAIVKKYAYNITGKNISPHKLRATYGTQLYNATGDIYFVQEQMHHENPKTTEKYIRGIKNSSKKASDIMANLTMK